MDVFRQRLEDEYDASVIVTAPTVPYKGTPCEHYSRLGMMLIPFWQCCTGTGGRSPLVTLQNFLMSQTRLRE